MRSNTKIVVASLLTSAIAINCFTPVLAQGYQTNYNQNYNQGYNQPIVVPNYQPAYQQPAYQQPAYQQNYNQSYNQSNYTQPLQGRIVLPRGAELSAAIASPMSSQYARTGDTVTATISSDVSSGGAVILPA
ncbi:MAG TPA: hypothetical protein DDX14_07535, partial [Cyanobacteria bacterium UBA9579]|nr:hypothetical protein [Cyanobacteria bacterium UBA9579]